MKNKPVYHFFPALSLLLHSGASRRGGKKKIYKLKKFWSYRIPDSDTMNEGLWVTLLSYMEEHKPYLDPGLSLQDLATDVYSNTTYVSGLINSVTGDNLNAFVNRYRVDYAQMLMKSDPSGKVKDYLLKSGFNNEVSFNYWFKRYVGDTPGKYLRRIRMETRLHPSRSEEQGK